MPSRRAVLAVEPDPAQAAATRVMQVLPQVMDAMRLAMRAQLDGSLTVPLTVPQFRGLNFVDRYPGSSVSALAAFLGVTLATASAMADRLVRAGYLLSQGSASDRRCAELSLCASGKAVLERMRAQTCDDLARVLSQRSAQELAALVDGLGVLDSAFAASAAVPATDTRPPAAARARRASRQPRHPVPASDAA
jgi:DNA-binding MarR family transcriptional regulator